MYGIYSLKNTLFYKHERKVKDKNKTGIHLRITYDFYNIQYFFRSDKEIITICQRIKKCHHVKIDQKNISKMQVFYSSFST